MPREFSRAARVAEQIQRDLSDLIRRGVKDPRVGMITITAVDVTRDLSHAKVYVTSLAGSESSERSVQALQHAAGFLRNQLARMLKVRSVPQLQFLYDPSIERGVALSHLIDTAVAADRSFAAESEGRED
jgi:ribosome-binding factor A